MTDRATAAQGGDDRPAEGARASGDNDVAAREIDHDRNPRRCCTFQYHDGRLPLHCVGLAAGLRFTWTALPADCDNAAEPPLAWLPRRATICRCRPPTISAPSFSTTSQVTVTKSYRRARSCLEMTRRCCSPIPAWCSSRTFFSAAKNCRTCARPTCSAVCVRAANTTIWILSATPRGITRFSKCSATCRLATISKRGDHLGVGTAHERVRIAEIDYSSRFITPTTKPTICGTRFGLPKIAIIRIGDSHRRQFLADGGHRTVRSVHGDFLRSRRGYSGRPSGIADEDGDRFVEIWNLVFMQYRSARPPARRRLAAPVYRHRHGVGALGGGLQQTRNYEIDLFSTLIKASARAPGRRRWENRFASRDCRSSSRGAFLIVDGVLPTKRRARLCAAPHHSARDASWLLLGCASRCF